MTSQASDVRRILVGDVEIAYETFGDPADPALLLVMGLGTQMLAWSDEMCSAFADDTNPNTVSSV